MDNPNARTATALMRARIVTIREDRAKVTTLHVVTSTGEHRTRCVILDSGGNVIHRPDGWTVRSRAADAQRLARVKAEQLRCALMNGAEGSVTLA